jgi:hypothetical protein
VLVADNLVRGLAVASVPIAAAAGVLVPAQLYVVAAIYGLLNMISLAGIPSILPSLVDEEDLSTANAMETISYGLGGIAGPALAGLLVGLFGAWCLWSCRDVRLRRLSRAIRTLTRRRAAETADGAAGDEPRRAGTGVRPSDGRRRALQRGS